MQRTKILISALTVLAVLLASSAMLLQPATEEEQCVTGEGNGVRTLDELIDAVDLCQTTILVAGEILLTGDTVLNIAQGADITIQSTGGLQYAIVLTDTARIVVEGKLTLINIDILQAAGHQYYDSNIPGHYDSPWFTLSGDAELNIYECVIESKKTLAGDMGLITCTDGTPAVVIKDSYLISNKRAVFGQSLGMTCFITDTIVRCQSEALFRADFILEGSTTFSSYSVDSHVYDFTRAAITGPTNPGEYVTFGKAGTGQSVYNPNYRIYYVTGNDVITLAAATEYTSTITITEDINFYVAIGFTHPATSVTYFSTPVLFECLYAPDGLTHTVTLPQGENYIAVPYGNSSSPVIHRDKFSFAVYPEYGYDVSAITVEANGVEIFAEGWVYTFRVVEDTVITVDGVSLSMYDVILLSGEGYSVTAYGNYLTSMAYGSTLAFSVDIDPGYDGSAMTVMINGWLEIFPTGGIYETVIDGYTEITVEGVIRTEIMCSVTILQGAGYEVVPDTNYESTMAYGSSFTFTVNIDPGYDGSAMAVKINGIPVSPNEDGIYEVSVDDDIIVTVVIALKTYAVTLSTGEEYTLNGESTVTHGSDYSFTMTVPNKYNKYTFEVFVNGIAIVAVAGKYTVYNVTEDLNVTVTVTPGNGGGNDNPSNPGGGPGTSNGNSGSNPGGGPGTNNGNPGNGGGNNGNPKP